ncbi:hypothetical protein [Erythrobacter sp. THAF29]|uniref:hypothetical protein n=1 Tax=Erythrobacter sp. THAF29 TaxID=2587851 RepID=UPI001267D4CC|nr:hypothetical protein [Erythrobacter sp. THAF29]QFT76111.1 hypothetical protein FIU90_01015 [Erythrobacter sp. THAF29]
MKEVLNPKVALAFVGVIIAVVLMFVGTEDDPGGLHRTVQALDENDAAPEPRSQREYPSELQDESLPEEGDDEEDREEASSVEWASDDDLVDRTEGFNTKPQPKIGPFRPIPQRETSPQSGPGPLSEEAKAEIRAKFGE